MRASYHSVHEPECDICGKHFRSLDSLREHVIGRLPKVQCAEVFNAGGCNICLRTFESSEALKKHKQICQMYPAHCPGLRAQMYRVNSSQSQGMEAAALDCKMVGGGGDGSLDLCARVCIIDEHENIIFHTYIKPHVPITNYRCRYEMTGIRVEHMREAMPLKQVQRTVEEILYNGEAPWRARSRGGRARILVGHGLDHDLKCLEIDYPDHLIRDTAKYPPLLKTSKLSNTLKYLTQAYLGYEIQTGVNDPYEDAAATMRLYKRMRSQDHPLEDPLPPNATLNSNNLPPWRLQEFEKMTPDAMLEISRSDYYCWCLDSKQG
ncbi:hypothetical protein AMTRI_Chr01g112660 [Amborella trichopoda]